jgi:hypothetical protein
MARPGGVEAQVERDSALAPPRSPDLPPGSLLSRIASQSRRASTSTAGSGSGSASGVSASSGNRSSQLGGGAGGVAASLAAMSLQPLPLEPLGGAAAQVALHTLAMRTPSAPPATLQHDSAALTSPSGVSLSEEATTGGAGTPDRPDGAPAPLQLQSVLPLTLLPLPDADYPSPGGTDGDASPAAGGGGGGGGLPLLQVQSVYLPPGAQQPYK